MFQASNLITNQRHLNDYGFACINGYKGTIREYLLHKYAQYCALCKRCDAEPMTLDDFRAANI